MSLKRAPFFLLTAILTLPGFGAEKTPPPDFQESCRQMFALLDGRGMSAEQASRIHQFSEEGRTKIEAAAALVDLLENAEDSLFDAYSFYSLRLYELDVVQTFGQSAIERLSQLEGLDPRFLLKQSMILKRTFDFAEEVAQAKYEQGQHQHLLTFTYALGGLFASIAPPPNIKFRKLDHYSDYLNNFFKTRGEKAPTLRQLLPHSRYLRKEFIERYLTMLNPRLVTTANFESAQNLLDEALNNTAHFKELCEEADREHRPTLGYSLSSAASYMQARLYPETREDKRQAELWLKAVLRHITLQTFARQAEESDSFSYVEILDRIKEFVTGDAINGKRYQSFFAILMAGQILKYEPLQPDLMRMRYKKALKNQIRIIARDAERELKARAPTTPLHQLPATIPQSVVGRKAPNVDSLVAQSLRQGRKGQVAEAPPPATTDLMISNDDLRPFISGVQSVDQIEANTPYKVLFLRKHPIFSGEQTVLFSAAVVKDFKSCTDERHTRFQDWLEGMRQGIAREWERGITKLRGGTYSWAVEIPGTRWRLEGDLNEQHRWFFQRFCEKK